MQECFRKHPDVYGDELADDDERPEAQAAEVEQKTAASNEGLSEAPRETAPLPDSPREVAPAASNTKESTV
jgi:intermembrane space import and assembly protein 40